MAEFSPMFARFRRGSQHKPLPSLVRGDEQKYTVLFRRKRIEGDTIVPATCVIGLQWGDEAKGKLVDLLTADFDIVARYQGGANAGHTVVAHGETYKLHLIPSGILNSDVLNLITAGVVLNPDTLLEEIRGLESRGVDVRRNLRLSDRAHVVFPWHLEEDRLQNARRVQGEQIGTTLRGIGPCYRDKVGRIHAVRLGDLLRADFAQNVERIADDKQIYFSGICGDATPATLDPQAIWRDYQAYAESLGDMIDDTTTILLNAAEQGKNILLEGAQGALLDIDHGTFPFVTSSNSSGVGLSAGSGLPGRWIEHVLGVLKCYTTRVGGGPFPTEQENETGEHIRQQGNEFGTTTGRPRRCGWFDAVAVRYSARLSGVDTLAVMMMDVLSELPEIKICVAYEIDGERTTDFPSHAEDLRRARPVYDTIPGWQSDVRHVRRMEDFPPAARAYLDRLSEVLERPVGVASVGPGREQTIVCDERLAHVAERIRRED